MTQFSRQPTASIPQACEHWGDIKAAYRFFDNEAVKPEQLLLPHSQATIQRMAAHAVVLVVQDTTSLNYSTHPDTEGLGPISNNADQTIGLFAHSTLALTTSGQPLGLVDRQVRSRDRRRFGGSRNAHQRNKKSVAGKESQRRLDSLRACQQAAPACPRTTSVNVTDREGDLYELFEQALQPDPPRVHVLVRARHKRKVQQSDEPKLWQSCRLARVVGPKEAFRALLSLQPGSGGAGSRHTTF